MSDATVKSPIELSEAQIRTAMKSKEHLKRWVHESGRQWFLLNGDHLVDALPWPSGVEALMQVFACYRDHRAALDTGETQLVEHAITKEMVETPLFYPETLTLTEMDRAIRWMVGRITELDYTWKLTDAPL